MTWDLPQSLLLTRCVELQSSGRTCRTRSTRRSSPKNVAGLRHLLMLDYKPWSGSITRQDAGNEAPERELQPCDGAAICPSLPFYTDAGLGSPSWALRRLSRTINTGFVSLRLCKVLLKCHSHLVRIFAAYSYLTFALSYLPSLRTAHIFTRDVLRNYHCYRIGRVGVTRQRAPLQSVSG